MISLYGLFIGCAIVLTGWCIEQLLSVKHSKPLPLNTWIAAYGSIVGGGLIGARLYHLATDWALYSHLSGMELFGAVVAVWNGGLGILGGLLGGVIGLVLWKSLCSSSWKWWEILDAAAIAVPFGQALGRMGNWANQELFGPPTAAPWGIFIDPGHRPEQFATSTHFHPLFAYESLSMIAIGTAFLMLWRWGARNKEQPFWQLGSGWWLSLYLLSYGLVRFTLDILRWDLTVGWLDLSWSQWGALAMMGTGLIILSLRAKVVIKHLIPVGVAALVSFWLLSPVFVSTAHAQTGPAAVDLSIEPAVVQIAVQPGKTVTQAISLGNSGTTDLEVVVTMVDFGADGVSGQPVLKDTSTFPYGRLNNADKELGKPFLLPANGQQQLVFAIVPPDTAPQRDWYFTLLATTKPAEGTVQSQSVVGAQTTGAIGANFLVSISNDEPGAVNWELGVGPLPKLLDSFQQLPIPVNVENLGSHVAQPDISVLVLDWRGNIVYEADGLPDRVLAHSRRQILTGIPSREDPRSMDPTEFMFDPLFAIGPYTVRTSLRNNAQNPIVIEQTIWALPFVLVGAIILCAVAIWFLKSNKISPGLKKIVEQGDSS